MNRKSIRAAGLALLLAALPSAASAAAPAEWTTSGRLPLRVFTDRDGLPQNAVTAIVFDREGALWIGTKDGAARYNGRAWTAVSMPAGSASNWINAILSASDGALWFATRGGGVARLKDGAWTVLGKSEGLPSSEALSLAESRGEILVGTTSGLARLQGARFVPMPLPAGTRSAWVTSIWPDVADGRATLWVGTRDGLLRRRGESWTKFDVQDPRNAQYNPVRGFARTSALGGRPQLVVATAFTGLQTIDGDRLTPVPLREGDTGAIQSLLVTREPGGRETLWVGAQQRLISIRDGVTRTFGPEHGFPEDGFWSLAESRDGSGAPVLWLGLSGSGLARWKRDGWTSFGRETLGDASVYALLETRDAKGESALWVGTNRRGLTRLDARGVTRFLQPARPGSDTVMSLLETGRPDSRTLWVGTTGGLAALRRGRWSLVSKRDGLPGSTINAMLSSPTPSDADALWLATGEGLARLESGRLTVVTDVYGLPDRRVNALLETRSAQGARVLWVGTERGLARREGDETRLFTMAHGLPADAILSLTETHEGGKRWLWVGTRGGAARADPEAANPSFRVFNDRSRPALPNNTVYQIRSDRLDRLYLCTNKGVARLTLGEGADRGEYEVYVFTPEDGLPSAECNTGASMVDGAGRIFVGTIAGAAVLDPAPLADAAPRPLRIERAILSKSGSPLREGAALAHDQGDIVFEYALLNFFRDEDTRYRAQLEGLDAQPSAWGADAKKEYTSLPEGHYVFKVWARDVAGSVVGPARLSFSVRPAPWRTWWAYLAWALLLAALVSLGVRLRLRTVRRRNEVLEAMIASRTSELADAVERLRESEQRALQAKDEALQASRAKSTFLANMSHELRTPLNAVIGFAQVLDRRGAVRAEDRESLRIIERSGEHLLGLINDVLSLSKIEAGALNLAIRSFDLPGLLEAVRAIILERADGKGLNLAFEVSPDLPRFVEGDEGKLRQVLINLLGNAVKFTPAGGRVTLRAARHDERVRFEVVDTGPGMTAEETASLFAAFAQTEAGRASLEGTGLGLAISREIVKRMGGDIEVTSAPGVGSTFRFEVRLEASASRPAAGERRVVGLAPGSPEARVLVVDDTEENRLLLRQLLTLAGFVVREAADGAQAVAAFEEFRPAVILMDARMPVMDGLAATRRIREVEARLGARRCGIIALTAGAFEHERDEMLREGADDFVAKPFNVNVIFERIARYADVRYVYEDDRAPASVTDRIPEASALSIERLSGLDRGLLRELREALESGQARRALAVGERIRAADSELGRLVVAEIQAFRFDGLIALIEAVDRPA